MVKDVPELDRLWFAVAHGVAIGGLKLSLVGGPTARDITGQSVAVDELSVDPEYRRQGVASALMRAVEDWVRNQPDLPRTISLGVETDNKDAVALYSKLGYAAAKRDGEAVTFMGSDGKPCYVYYKILNQDSV